MQVETIRVGVIGAGSIVRQRHLPGLQKLPGVVVQAVANRSVESGRKVAQEFAIPQVLSDWRELVARPDLEAIFIGTWPYMHMEMSVAALEAGKHVFCQARMAMDLDQARRMLAAAQSRPNQVAMICPPPHRMPFEPYVRRVLANGTLGAVRLVELRSISGANLDRQSVSWRERVEYSGRHALAVGIYAEVLNAWLGPYASLSAQMATPMATKRDAWGATVTIGVPQIVTVTGRLAGGALVVEEHSGVAADGASRGETLVIWGEKATLRHTFSPSAIELAPAGGTWAPVAVPHIEQRGWWAEEEFITAVRHARAGESWRVTPGFAEGFEYMQKMEAIHLSARSGQVVDPRTL